jgi:hypothetical protein
MVTSGAQPHGTLKVRQDLQDTSRMNISEGIHSSGSRVACAILLRSVQGPSSPRGPSGDRYENKQFP